MQRSPLLDRTYGGLPVPIWGALVACVFMMTGWNWDISWHRSVGRDTIWTLPHIAIYIALAIAFAYNAWLVLRHTFGSCREVPAIRVLGFRGPAGSFITLWGILMQFTGILFDDWWHDVYGLDSFVATPAHQLLATGIFAFYVGQALLVVQFRNLRLAEGRENDRVALWAVLFLFAFCIAQEAISMDPNYGHMGLRSRVATMSFTTAFAFFFVLMHTYVGWKWSAPAVAAIYMLVSIVLMQIFQLFPATPRLGPVYHRGYPFMPPLFPMLLIIPTLVIGPILGRRREGKRLLSFLLLAVAFLVLFNASNWLLSAFIETEWADNRFFAGGFPPNNFELDYRPVRSLGFDASSAVVVLIALATTTAACYAGTAAGGWLRRLVR